MHGWVLMERSQLLRHIEWVGHTTSYTALKAVVDLHEPEEVTLPDGEWGILCIHCSEYGVYVLYPCKTIRAIEKELA